MLATRRADLHAALAAAAADARARDARGRCGARLGVRGGRRPNADRRLIDEVLRRCFPTLRSFALGEVGMQAAGRCAGWMIHIALFGRQLSAEGRAASAADQGR